MFSKKIIIIILLAAIFISTNSIAQKNQNEYTSIFNKKKDQKIEHGGYGSIGFGYTTIDGKDAVQVSFKGAWVIDHNIAIGLAGYSFVNDLEKSTTTGVNETFLGGGYGGFFIEPIILPNSPIHVSFPILFGAGGISSFTKTEWQNDDFEINNNDYDVFFVFEPGVELEFNMVKFFRLAIGGSYRFTNGILLNNSQGTLVSTDALDSYNIYMNLKFGKF